MDAGSGNRLKIIPHSDRAHAQVPKKFIGLSYDSNTLSDVNFFSASNEGLVDLFRKMTPNGVLRLGGGSLDVEWWAGSSSSDVPSLPPTFAIPPHPTGYAFRPFSVEITPESIEALKGFLNATGWTCIYGLNLATGTPARAAEEADFVAKTLGSLLEFFQIGNEPDLYNRFCRNPATWSADRYFDEWLPMANAVRARVPHARFALPDLGYDSTWFTPVVNRLLEVPAAKRADVVGISHHYYALSLKNPNTTASKLLQPEPVFDHLWWKIGASCQRANLLVTGRVTEVKVSAKQCKLMVVDARPRAFMRPCLLVGGIIASSLWRISRRKLPVVCLIILKMWRMAIG